MDPSSPASSSYDEFAAGVTACLRTWSALRTAVEHGWTTSSGIEEQIRSTILSCFDGISRIPQKPLSTLYDLEDYLFAMMEDYYSVVLEDNSEQQIAETIMTLYDQCCFYHHYELSRQLVSVAMRNFGANHPPPTSTGAVGLPTESILPSDSDSDDDDMVGGDDHNNDGNDIIDDDAMMDIEMMTVDEPENITAPPESIQIQQQQQHQHQQQQMQQQQIQQQSQQQQQAAQTTLLIPCPNYSAKEYWNHPLFPSHHHGPVKKKTDNAVVPVRQLGEPMAPAASKVIVDDDGFAMVPKKNKKKT